MNNKKISPTTHLFLWDLHEVILEKNIQHWFALLIRFNKKWDLLKKLDRKSLYILITFSLERIGIIKKQMVSEELITAAKQANNSALIELIELICSAYIPIQGTLDIMERLSQLGYTHHLGSNIGQTVYDACFTKFSSVFTLFDGYTIPYNNTKKEIVKKPHQDFFTTHIKKYNLSADQCIFIDDKHANVQSAESVGMHAIHFKNPKQLYAELVARCIFTE